MKEIQEFPKQIKVNNEIELRFTQPTFENAKETFVLIDNNREQSYHGYHLLLKILLQQQKILLDF